MKVVIIIIMYTDSEQDLFMSHLSQEAYERIHESNYYYFHFVLQNGSKQ